MPPKASRKKKEKAQLSLGLIERSLAVDRVELRATMLDNVTPEEHGGVSTRPRLSFAAIEQAMKDDPMIYGGVNKKSLDMTKRWHGFDPTNATDDDPDEDTVQRLLEFERRVDLRAVVTQAIADVLLYGDGYLEVVTENDNGSAETPLAPGRITELARVVPSTITPVREKNPKSRDVGKIKFYRQQSGGVVLKIHPSRIHRLTFVPLGDDARGLGAVEAAIRSIIAKEKGDRAAGDQLAWYAKGIVEATVADATTEELEATWKTLIKARKEGSNILVGSDRHKYAIHNAAVINPQPFYDEFHYNYASALGMPKDVLIGASAGAVTGSETNLRDYYESCDALLQTKITPWLRALYAIELGVEKAAFPLPIVWAKLYVNEKAEADARFTNAQACSIAVRDRWMTPNEARRIAFGLGPIDGGDKIQSESFAFPGFDDGSAPEAKAPEDELRELAGDNA